MRRGWRNLAVLGAVLLFGACQQAGAGPPSEEGEEIGDPDAQLDAAPPVEIAPDPPEAKRKVAVRAHIEPRGYKSDPRFARLAAEWPERVERALARLPVVTGLTFAAGPSPRVALRPLGDETIPFEVRVDVVEGRRRAGLLVNAEPLLAGTADADRTLLHGLGAAVLEDSRARRGDAPAWVVAMAGLAAGGDLDARLGLLHRDFVLGNRDALQVDPMDESVSNGTALAAFVLLAERATPYDVRRFLQAVAGGDEPNEIMGRLTGESGTGWADAARLALAARVRERDDTPWTLLQQAETALEESGRAGLLATLPERVPPEVGDELRVLRARAALAEGDGQAARTELRALSGEAFRSLRDPAGVVVLRVESEMAKGGDPELARRFARQHELDFPSHPAGPRVRDLASERGLQEDPQAWMRAMGHRIAREGAGSLDLGQAERYARALLLDHRAGAAEQFLLGMGARGHALELHTVSRATADAQEDPTRAARARASDRIGVWLQSPGERAEQDVVDGGVASAAVLAEMLVASPNAPVAERERVVDLLARSAGTARVLRVLRTVWLQDNRLMLRDLRVLTRHVPLDAIEVAVFDSDIAQIAGRTPDAVWDVVAFGISREWLREHPAFLERLRDPVFSTRLRAFDGLARDPTVVATPALIGHMLTDESPVLRRRAVELAGRGGFQALAATALDDPHPSVRRTACVALARSQGPAAVPALLRRLRSDEDGEVRSVAAWSLLEAAPNDPRVLDALLALQRAEDPRVREPLAREMPKVQRAALGPALSRAIRGELRKRQPSRPALFRWMAIFQRASDIDPGFHPGSTRPEIFAMVDRIERWAVLARSEGR